MSARLVKARWAAAIIAMGLIAATPWAVQAYRGGPSSLTVEVDVPLYTIEEGSAGRERRVAVDGYVSEYAQGLGLPEGGILLGVPVNGGDFRIVSVESSFQLVHTGLGPDGGPRRLATEGERAEAAATWANNDIVEMGEMGFLRYQRFLRLTLRPVQYNKSNGQLAYHPDITVKIEYTKGAVDGFSSAGNEDSEVFEDIYAQAIHNYDQARKWRVRPDPEAPDSALTEALSATDAQAFKLAIDQDGLHRVSHQELVAAGLPDASVGLDSLRLFAPDGEAAFEPIVAHQDSFGPGDHLRFYARVAPNKYSDSSVYWLVAGAGPGKAIAAVNRPPAGSPSQNYVSKTSIEENKIYRSVLPRLEGAEHWFWALINAVDGQAARQDFAFEMPVESLLDSDWSMTVNVVGFPTGLDEGKFAADLLLNGSPVGPLQWEGYVPYAGAVTFPGSLLRQGENTLTVEVPEGRRGVSTLIFVDWLELEGPRRLRAHNASLEFSDANQPGSYLVSGFDNADLTAYDITDPLKPVKVLGGEIALDDGGHAMAFGAGSTAPRRYLISTPDGLLRPSSIQHAPRPGLAGPPGRLSGHNTPRLWKRAAAAGELLRGPGPAGEGSGRPRHLR